MILERKNMKVELIIFIFILIIGILCGCNDNEVEKKENELPACSISAVPSSGNAPLIVTFTMIASDTDGTISSWTLDVDNDGVSEYSGSGNPPATKEHIYENNGTYTANLTVIDNNDAACTATKIITVS
jgi:PKD repeat protein